MALQKLRKLRDTIRNLPAAAQREQLVEAVKAHPVVLVAGAMGDRVMRDVVVVVFGDNGYIINWGEFYVGTIMIWGG